MDEEIERLVVSVRADTAAFARDVAALRGELEGPLSAGAERAGRAMESALVRAVRTGKLGFDDLRRVALSTLAEIAAASVRSGIGSIVASLPLPALPGFGGLPGRATGGPVAPGRAYLVGERGPEVFVPTASGRVAAPVTGGGREVRVTVNVNAPAGTDAPVALARSSRQVARAVRAALAAD